MPLPTAPLATGEVTIGGTVVTFRSLSRAQALKLNDFRADPDAAEVFILVSGTGCSEEEAQAFRESNDTDTAGLLIDGILIASGLAGKDGADPKA
jgi:hypothetical protein